MSEHVKSDAEESNGAQNGAHLALHEQVPARDAQSITDEQQNRKIDVLADRIKRGELWIIMLTAAMTVAAFAAVYVARKQWLVAERQTNLMQEQLRDARSAAAESSNVTARTLAALEKQADAMTNSIGPATTNAATAAQTNAKTSERIAKASERSISATHDALRLDQRARLGVSKISGSEPTAGQPVAVYVELTNTGKTPAKNVEVISFVQALRPKAPITMPDFGTIATIPDEVRSRGLMPPNTQITIFGAMYSNPTGDKVILNEETVKEISDGRALLVVRGRVTYRDVFNRPHWTTFCFVSIQPPTRFASCDQGNDSDPD